MTHGMANFARQMEDNMQSIQESAVRHSGGGRWGVRLLLVRHGETVDNAAQIMQGQTQGRLNERGIGQARDLAARLASEHVDAFVSSDLRRAIQTAEIIARPHQARVSTTPLLRERDWGGFTGRFIPSLKGEEWPSDIETLEALQERARRFLSLVGSRWPNRTVVAVGHGIINKAIQAVHFRLAMQDVKKMGNAEVRELLL